MESEYDDEEYEKMRRRQSDAAKSSECCGEPLVRSPDENNVFYCVSCGEKQR